MTLKEQEEKLITDYLPEGCRSFGAGSTPIKIKDWLMKWSVKEKDISFFLILAATRTAEIDGISAAGSTPEARKYTALADAELLINGPSKKKDWQLPPLPAGVSPALISYVATKYINLKTLILPLGLIDQPSFPHMKIEFSSFGPADCLSSGRAMDISRVKSLWEKGLAIGRGLEGPLLLAECVPGGTTTAQAVLTGLGMEVSHLISGSFIDPPIKLKKTLVSKGLYASGLGSNPTARNLLAAVGDPFQAFSAGLVLGAREADKQVLMGGGSQMLAVLALALSELKSSSRRNFVEGIVLGTTAWLAEESSSINDQSGLEGLMNVVGNFFDVGLIGISSGLRFKGSTNKLLLDYELGYVKEGVGAGALALLAQLNGASSDQLLSDCEAAIQALNSN